MPPKRSILASAGLPAPGPRRALGLLLLAGLASCASAGGESAPRSSGGAAAVEAVLDDFHGAAARADGERYFALFADDAIFLGTDPSERWTVAEFQAYAEPYFSTGRGWTYESVERHVFVAPDGATAWFDERLANENLGECRGTGVLRLIGHRWRIAQYNLTLPVPNDLAGELVEKIREDR